METRILNNNITDQVRQSVERDKQDSSRSSGGLIQAGETVNGYAIQNLMKTDSGEAEIYRCARGGSPFVFKYYYTKRPKEEVIAKLKGFRHPDILSLVEYGEYKERFYEILEYAQGGALDDKKIDGAYKYLPVSEKTALQIVKETINAFDVCHKAGIIHRDIKPGNLFYKNADGTNILIGDFGISSSFDADEGMSKHLTQTSERTEGYAAPESYSGLIGPEMDYYSLGITVWALLTGEEPFVNEKGQPMYPGQIMNDAMQGRVADMLLTRAPGLSPRVQQLIRGLLTVRHDKRWKYEQVTKFLAGETVEVFNEIRELPPFEIAGTQCFTYKDIAQALLARPQEGKDCIYKGKLVPYLFQIDQSLGEKIFDLSDTYSAKNKPDEGLVFISYTLCPNLPFKIDANNAVSSLKDVLNLLESNPMSVIPYLRDTTKGFYTYLEAQGLGENTKTVLEIVNSIPIDLKMVPRVTVALRGNSITPFQDGVNNELRLESIEQLYALPEYLQQRILLFIEKKTGLIAPWIENLTGLNIDLWLYKLDHQRDKLKEQGKWNYFTQFLQRKDEPLDGRVLWHILKGLKNQERYFEMNRTIGEVYQILYNKRYYEACRRILILINSNRMEGLSAPYHYYRLMIGKTLLKEDLPDVAIDFFEEALRIAPDNPELLAKKGETLASMKQYQEAITCYTLAIDNAKDDKNKELFSKNRAAAYAALGMPDKGKQ
jgi:serine/threonine protein kinase